MHSIDIEIPATCPNCGSTENLDFSDDKTYAECTFCGMVYNGGEDEVKEKMLDMPEIQEKLRNAAYLEAEKLLIRKLKNIKGFRIQ